MKGCFIISGLVQGVGFRYSVYRLVKSKYPEIIGYVKNLSDGKVELCMACEERIASKFLEELKNLEFSGYIADIEKKGAFLSGHYNDFMIEY